MTITLVHPPVILFGWKVQPNVQPPLGLAYVAACLREAGHTVRVVDGLGEGFRRHSLFRENAYLCGLPIDEIVDRVEPESDVIGIGIMFSNLWPLARILIRKLRERFPRAIIICGGEHVTALTRFVMEDAPIDYAVWGEGEETAVELMAHLAGTPGSLPPERVAGLAYRAADGTIVTTPRRQRRRKLDQIPWPAWDLFPVKQYVDARSFCTMSFDPDQRPMVIVGTRGCPYTCTFCSNEQMWGTNYFMRSPKDIVDEMQFYVQTYGVTDFHFQDLTPIINGRWAHHLCDEIINRKLGITWKPAIGTRSEALDAELLKKMSLSGCDELVLAPESGSPEITTLTRKRIDLDRVLTVTRMVRDQRLSMRVTAQMVIGFPEERLYNVWQTYRYLIAMARAGFSTILVHRFTAYPGCEYHAVAVREGRIVHNDEYFLSLIHSAPGNQVSWHPRWSGGFVSILITLANAIFFGTYYLRKPAQLARAVWSVLRRQPRTRVERHFVFRLWGGPVEMQRQREVPARSAPM